jgi:hypothetical protein
VACELSRLSMVVVESADPGVKQAWTGHGGRNRAPRRRNGQWLQYPTNQLHVCASTKIPGGGSSKSKGGRQAGREIQCRAERRMLDLRGGSVNYGKWDVEAEVKTRAVRGQQQHFRTEFGARKAPWDTGRAERSRRWTKRREEGR